MEINQHSDKEASVNTTDKHSGHGSGLVELTITLGHGSGLVELTVTPGHEPGLVELNSTQEHEKVSPN